MSRQLGDPDLNGLFDEHRDRLCRMVQVRMDERLRRRVDASDVVQEAYLEAARRYVEYRERPEVPVFIWLRFLTGQKLLQLQRQHLGAKARDARRDVSLSYGSMPGAASAYLAAELVSDHTSPSQAAMRVELTTQVHAALEEMDVLDREVLALRHFEQLSNPEAAQTLGVSEAACYKRYVRALRRMKEVLASLPAGPTP